MSLASGVMAQKRRESSLEFKAWIQRAPASVFDMEGGIIPQTNACDLFVAKSGKIAFILEERSRTTKLSQKEKTRAAQLVASNIVSIAQNDMKVHSAGSFFTNVSFPGACTPDLEVSLYALHDISTGEMRHEIPVTVDLKETRGNPIFVVRIIPHVD